MRNRQQYLRNVLKIAFFCTILNLSCKESSISDSCFSLDGTIVFVSMKKLALKHLLAIDSNQKLDSTTVALAGLSWISGYIYDEKNSDIILMGRRDDKRPAYQLEDLMNLFNNVFCDSVAPFCSLDPLPENISKIGVLFKENNVIPMTQIPEVLGKIKGAMGPQIIVIGGVQRNSITGFIMIDADYHMKKASQGLIAINSVRPSFQNRKNVDFKSNENITMSRFWFHIKPNDENVYPSFFDGDSVLTISSCPIVLLTEQQLAGTNGVLKDIDDIDTNARNFAEDISNQFSAISNDISVYAALENHYRLFALFKAMKFKNVLLKTDPLIKRFFRNYQISSTRKMPDSLPCIANWNKSNASVSQLDNQTKEQPIHFVVGGVNLEMQLTIENFFAGDAPFHFWEQIHSHSHDTTEYLWEDSIINQTSFNK